MKLTLVEVPYDSGHFARRMGRGPLRLMERGLAAALAERGHEVEVVPVRLPEGFTTEAGTAVEIQRRLSGLVAAARRDGRVPLILSGNCNTCVGTLSGIASTLLAPSGNVGVIWLDAHGDLNTPETSLSGFFDGMALSMATGNAWQALAGTVPGFRPVAERNVLLVGARDLDPAEAERIERSEITHLPPAALRDGAAALIAALDDLATRVSHVYLHVDLDVLDPAEARVNVYSAPDGLTVAQVAALAAAVGERFEIVAAALTAYDPDEDADGRAAQAAETLAQAIAAALPSPG